LRFQPFYRGISFAAAGSRDLTAFDVDPGPPAARRSTATDPHRVPSSHMIVIKQLKQISEQFDRSRSFENTSIKFLIFNFFQIWPNNPPCE
jgi:hypothetical protein